MNHLLRSVGLGGMAREPRLTEHLDTGDGEPSAAPAAAAGNGHHPEDGSQHYYEEHLARLNAEGQAADSHRRLQVAQEQVAEFAAQREEEAKALLQQVDVALGGLAANGGASVGELLEGIRQRLQDFALEAAAFSAQQKADAERSKRSYSQADLKGSQNGDLEMKRHKDDSPRAMQEDGDEEGEEPGLQQQQQEAAAAAGSLPPAGGEFLERAKYIPLRLQHEERRLLRLLEAALSVSEYTDKIDIHSWKSKNQRVHKQLTLICGILCGLVLAEDYKKGQALVADRHFRDNADFFRDIFEVGRRYKIMNPDKMRSEYGKLVYLLQDAAEPHMQELLEFNVVRPLRTVHALLEEKGGLAMLGDPLMHRATAEIVSLGRSRAEIQRDIRDKERSRDMLARRYRSRQLPEEDILHCLYSIGDNNSFLLFNRDPVDRAIAYMKHYFRPGAAEPGFSLGISMGAGGARLSHSHERQYNYVLQSLMLWREISHDMFKLWYLAESDLLREGNSYRLTNTGQGLNRVQQAPAVAKAMQGVLWRCQQTLGSWVGSSVVHLGDHNVPNALMFIDKYNQVPRILNPVVHALDSLPALYKDAAARAHIDSLYGDLETARKTILLDFLRHGFDGSGADNFFDAGSCIDGRLTSLWHWASQIEKKPYFSLFKLAGFSGFDGEWK